MKHSSMNTPQVIPSPREWSIAWLIIKIGVVNCMSCLPLITTIRRFPWKNKRMSSTKFVTLIFAFSPTERDKVLGS